MKLVDLKVAEFLEELARGSPSPGGGSASALAGALGAALVAMVADLTLGKERYKNVEDELKEVSRKAASLKDRMMCLVDEDSQAFDALLAALRFPQDSAEAKGKRGVEVQRATRRAAEVPLEVARHSIKIVELAEVVIQKGNVNAISDGGVAALLGEAAFRGAVYNVKINLSSLQDETYRKAVEQELRDLEGQMAILKNGVAQLMDKKLL
ncbi:cyclodeaminase/cyclohydrolase family protein [Dehalococcoidia bacterium]|nr:cyclodeaminase/cyclohydrolase family protein [Dehalococcoidia bacterium]MCL0078564.1 cyclodeaminase/cyclohydrolase family protein [Dehalococcoidia bacterium]